MPTLQRPSMILSRLPPRMTTQLFASALKRVAKAGEALFVAGDRGDGCYRVEQGLVKITPQLPDDPPPLKWSDLRYVFDIKEDCNGKEAIQARRDRREAGGCSGLAGPEIAGCAGRFPI